MISTPEPDPEHQEGGAQQARIPVCHRKHALAMQTLLLLCGGLGEALDKLRSEVQLTYILKLQLLDALSPKLLALRLHGSEIQ